MGAISKGLFSSSGFAGHLREAEAWIRAQESREILIVAGRWGAADDLARRVAARTGGCLGIHRYTLLQLATELATLGLSRAGLSPLTGLGFQALCARVAYICNGEKTLDYLAPVAESPGFVRSLAATIRELRLQGVAATAVSGAGLSGSDLSRLLEAFERELERRRLADFAQIFATATAEARGRHRLLGLPLLLLALQPRTLAEERFLEALASRSDCVLATVLAEDEVTRSMINRVLANPPAASSQEDSPRLPPSATRLERLRRFLFATDSAEGPPAPDDPSVEFFSEPGQGRESVEIARRIRTAVESGVRFDQIAILLRSPEAYYPLVEEAMRRAGVPAYFTRGAIRPNPAGRAFLALLESASENLSARRFAEYLSLGQAPIPDQSGAPPASEVPWVEPEDEQLCFKTLSAPQLKEDPILPDLETDPVIAGSLRTPAHWEHLLVEASVIGGLDRWKRRLEGLAAEWQLGMSVLEVNSAQYRRLQEKLQRLQGLQKFALPLIERLGQLPKQANWSEWISSLEELAVSALRQPYSVLALLAELGPMGDVGPVGLEEVRRVLGDRLTLLRQEPPRDRYGQVFVATPEEVAGRSFEWVFLPGLAEGLFPRKALEDPLLLDPYRRQLRLESAVEQRRRGERLLLRTAVASVKSRLVVSYPRMDLQQGRSRVPSFYALDIIRAAEGRLPDVGRLEKQASRASSTRLGWPAPRDSHQAIDDTEYDLSVLEPLLKRPSAEAGAARFLLEVNPHLARSLRGRWQRWNSTRFTPADGLVDPSPATKRLVTEESLKLRSYSPTALQTFSSCPYKFFLYALHRLELREEAVAVEQLDPLTRGALFHKVQFQLLTELRDERLLPIGSTNESDVTARAEAILQKISKQYEDELSPAIPRIWRNEIDQLGADLRGWIREEAADRSDWVPERFEFSFGLPRGGDHDPSSRSEAAEILGGYKVRGSIDLLERSPSRHTYRVTDHKTGRAPSESAIVVKKGELLQPLLYSLAVENLLGEPVEKGRLFYCTQRGDFRSLEVTVDSVNSSRLQTVLEVIEESIINGFLPAFPADRACEFCDFRSICGPNEGRRTSKKETRLLAGLFQLRELP